MTMLNKYKIADKVANLPEVGYILTEAQWLDTDFQILQEQLEVLLERRTKIIEQIHKVWTDDEAKSAGF